jgi:hypothetical protein
MRCLRAAFGSEGCPLMADEPKSNIQQQEGEEGQGAAGSAGHFGLRVVWVLKSARRAGWLAASALTASRAWPAPVARADVSTAKECWPLADCVSASCQMEA